MLIGIEASAAVARRRTGVGHYAANLMAALRRVSGDETEFLYFSNRYDPAAAREGALVPGPIYEHDRLPSQMAWLQLGLPRSILRTRPDICHFPNHLLPILDLPARPSVVTVHDMSVYRFPWSQPTKAVVVHRALLPLVRRGNCMVVTGSNSARDDILDRLRLPPERVRVVYEGVDPTFSPVSRTEDVDVLAAHGITFPYVLSVGTLEPRKNQSRLIEAFAALVRQERVPHHLVLVGAEGWKDAKLRQQMRRPDMAGRIHALGYVPTAHLPALYRGADAFAFPSLYEGFGLSALEALACGTPALISTDRALREIAGDAALAADPYSVESIGAGLWQLLSDHTLARALEARGVARSRQFTWDRCGAETMGLYREMLGAPVTAGAAMAAR